MTLTPPRTIAALGIAIAMMAAVACQRSTDIYNSYVALPNTGWTIDSLAVFRVDITDADKPYDLYFMVRNQNNYAYQNLWLFIDIVSPDGYVQRDTLDCILAEHDGRWKGSGWGSLYDAEYPYRLSTRFAAPGLYRFRVCHGMRQDDIEGIHSIGLRVTPTQPAQE